MTESDTPLTDDAAYHDDNSGYELVDADHARQMERERGELLQAILDACKDFYDVRWGYDGCCGSTRIMDRLSDLIDRLEGENEQPRTERINREMSTDQNPASPPPSCSAIPVLGQDSETQVFCYERDFYPFSNFSAFVLFWEGREFMTSEHAYQWEKFRDTAPEVQGRIFAAGSAHVAFKIAEENKALRRPGWDHEKFPTMAAILKAKAEQHEYVMHKLRQSGTREIVEDSWRDSCWGWGPNRDGENLLGKAWMLVRAELIPSQNDQCPATEQGEVGSD